jgi:hypothetical protein
MVKAGNLWTSVEKEPIKDWSTVRKEQHLSLHGGVAEYNPNTMKTYKLVD